MELLIKAKDIFVEYTRRDVLNINELELYSYDKIGLVRENGAGSFAYIPHLDEAPTSHLDREGIDFLIGQLKYFEGALLIISHDKRLVDNVADTIYAMKDKKIIKIK